ncbi:pyridoxamine 5'-phosphate oxidase family protein [Novosphingopyxis sp.]|uniref:pyridoxamine 5'-phosphate oxidase family protein n=1 Tax=Novosphingopyxis sp. TaxID=2709690 RepID=UPI003B5B5D64
MDQRDIIKQFWKALDKSPFVMIGIPAQNAHSEPMTAQFDDDIPNALFFYARRDNRLATGMASHPQAMVQFTGKGHDFFACISGMLSVSDDPRLIDKFWSNAIEAWFDGGKDDPNLTLLRFDMKNAEMWEADLSAGNKLKMLFGGDIDYGDPNEKHIETTM